MPCCAQTILPFFNTTVSNVPYSGVYGERPTVNVMYWDGERYVAMGVFTQVSLIGSPINNIRIDHGGPATGLIKLN